MTGVKTVEFRKRPFGRDVTHVVVYASSPVQMVLGFFEVDSVDEASPDALWRRYSAVGAIQRRDYDTYFGAAKSGVAIRVRRVHALKNPVELATVLASGRAPQSYAYLPGEVVGRLGRRKAHSPTGTSPA